MKTTSLKLSKDLKKADIIQDMKTERWKAVSSHEGLYEVSSFGRVKSLPHAYSPSITYLKGKLTNAGYFIVTLRNRATHKDVTIHRLVAMAFIPNPENKKTINHKDGNKQNNVVENLEWASYSENNKHLYAIGLRDTAGLRKSYIERFSKKVGQYSLEGVLIQEWPSASEASRSLGISTASISLCATGKHSKSHGFIWRYL